MTKYFVINTYANIYIHSLMSSLLLMSALLFILAKWDSLNILVDFGNKDIHYQ